MGENNIAPEFLKPQQTSIDEIHQIISALRGVSGKNDGDYRSLHLGTVLQYLQTMKREEKRLTLAKLSLMLGMAQRQVKENYFDGLIAFGIINMNPKCDEWYWVGLSALTKTLGEPTNHMENTQ
jgi:hypothetical protein